MNPQTRCGTGPQPLPNHCQHRAWHSPVPWPTCLALDSLGPTRPSRSCPGSLPLLSVPQLSLPALQARCQPSSAPGPMSYQAGLPVVCPLGAQRLRGRRSPRKLRAWLCELGGSCVASLFPPGAFCGPAVGCPRFQVAWEQASGSHTSGLPVAPGALEAGSGQPQMRPVPASTQARPQKSRGSFFQKECWESPESSAGGAVACVTWADCVYGGAPIGRGRSAAWAPPSSAGHVAPAASGLCSTPF